MDVKETKEVLDLLNETAVFAAKILKDGIQAKQDFEAVYEKLIKDEEFRDVVKKAFDGINRVPLEIKDISSLEIIDLAFHELKAVKSILSVLLAK